MPKYHSTGIEMRLGVTSLADTVGKDLKRRKNEAARSSELFEERLRKSEFLREENVVFPGDTNGFRVNFMKSRFPFLQVQVGGDIDRGIRERALLRPAQTASRRSEDDKNNLTATPSTAYRTDRHVTPAHSFLSPLSATLPIPSPYLDKALRSSVLKDDRAIPGALVLHILLSQQTFLESFEDGKPQNLMIDVFFNGMLASSILMQLRDCTSGVKSMHQIVTGTRADWLIERPWVIMPPGKAANGTIRGDRKAVGAKERWEQICAALMKEANERGFNKWRERPPSADYLEGLAAMSMPDGVGAMQRPGGRTFGVIDVVVTAGKGQKITGDYLKEPTRLPDGRYRKRKEVEGRSSEQDDGIGMAQESSLAKGQTTMDQDAEGETDGELEQRLPASLQLPPVPPPYPSFLPQQAALPQSSTPSFLDYTSEMDAHFPSTISMEPIEGQVPFRGPSTQAQGVVDPSLVFDPFPAPNLSTSEARRMSNSNASMPLYNMAAPLSEISTLGMPGRGAFATPASLTDISPLAQRNRSREHVFFECSPFPAPPLSLPNFPLIGPVRHRGPLPPVGLFSALPRPKPKMPTDSGQVDPGQPRASFLMSRLFIIGKNGTIVIDHRWPIAQRIAIRQKPKMQTRSSVRKRQDTSDSEYMDSRASTKRRKGSGRVRMATPPPTSSSEGNLDKPLNVDKSIRGAIHDSKSPHADTNVLGIHGPKADPFILDGPEEILRRQERPTRVQASIAPVLAPHPSSAPQGISTPMGARIPWLSDLFNSHSGSSPLSSAPSSPEPASGQLSASDMNPASTPLQPKAPRPAPAQRPPHTPYAPPQPRSMSKQSSSQPSHAASIFGSRPRSTGQRTRRGPSIIPTDNPRLNQDCVICFAEGSEEDAPVLRQVKCERQGVFAEDMVVVGMRFFVSG